MRCNTDIPIENPEQNSTLVDSLDKVNLSAPRIAEILGALSNSNHSEAYLRLRYNLSIEQLGQLLETKLISIERDALNTFFCLTKIGDDFLSFYRQPNLDFSLLNNTEVLKS